MQQQDNQEISYIGLFYIIYKYKKILISIMAVVSLVCFVWMFTLHQQYQATLYLKMGNILLKDGEVSLLEPVSESIIKSENMYTKVNILKKLSIDSNDGQGKLFMKSLKIIQPDMNVPILSISLCAYSEELALKLVDAVSQEIIQSHYVIFDNIKQKANSEIKLIENQEEFIKQLLLLPQATGDKSPHVVLQENNQFVFSKFLEIESALRTQKNQLLNSINMMTMTHPTSKPLVLKYPGNIFNKGLFLVLIMCLSFILSTLGLSIMEKLLAIKRLMLIQG